MPEYSLTSRQTASNDLQFSSSIKVDSSLTFQNSEAKGYQWVKDTIFSSKTSAIFQDIINLVGSGYRLGRPKIITESKVLVGLYKPK